MATGSESVKAIAPSVDKTAARKMVLLSSLALVLIAVYRSSQPGSNVNLYKRIWGAGVFAMMLALLADFAPGVAGPFAGLTVLGALTKGGDSALQNLLGFLGTIAPSSGTPIVHGGTDVNPATNPDAAGPPAPTTTGGKL